MAKIIQIKEITEDELFGRFETLIDKKLAILTSVDKNVKLSIKSTAEELEVAELTVHNYIKKGILPAFKIGRRVFIKREDLDEALKEVKSLKYKR
ncbi:helix-turn-helix domain-containing protein [Algibacter sp. AS12]|uniref:helix-turn-helix domain-containing protein n=1 Tax=Algibacter sp. AS12 TaxID=3135773 RepID=UPI00398B342F